jgi:excisionase family DNA binding protein
MSAFLEEYSTVDALAEEIGVSVRTIRRWAREGSPALPVHRLGRRRLVARRDFDAWLAASRVQRNARRTVVRT